MSRLGLFDAFGIELEYMLVDAQSLDVAPISDRLIQSFAGEITGDIEFGAIGWSNELVLHVLEMKTASPAPNIHGSLVKEFQANVDRANERLKEFGARLMPSAMHPWMDPFQEMRLWPHEYSVVYSTFDRIFDCRGHGWANLQSAHLNLPFASDEEFGRLHAAVRIALPLLPAIAASSPIWESRVAANLDQRLDVYRHNSARIPTIAGQIIPEEAYSESQYETLIYEPLMRDIATYDTQGVLEKQFLNARGAIARFDRGAIEIRLLDVQECVAADLANHLLIVELIRALVEERWVSYEDQCRASIETLFPVLLSGIAHAERATVSDPDFLSLMPKAVARAKPISHGELWRTLVEELGILPRLTEPSLQNAIVTIMNQGPLSRRILKALNDPPAGSVLPRSQMAEVYEALCECLAKGQMFVP